MFTSRLRHSDSIIRWMISAAAIVSIVTLLTFELTRPSARRRLPSRIDKSHFGVKWYTLSVPGDDFLVNGKRVNETLWKDYYGWTPVNEKGQGAIEALYQD